MSNYKRPKHEVIKAFEEKDYEVTVLPVETSVLELLKRNAPITSPSYFGIRDLSNASLMETKSMLSTNKEEIAQYKQTLQNISEAQRAQKTPPIITDEPK